MYLISWHDIVKFERQTLLIDWDFSVGSCLNKFLSHKRLEKHTIRWNINVEIQKCKFIFEGIGINKMSSRYYIIFIQSINKYQILSFPSNTHHYYADNSPGMIWENPTLALQNWKSLNYRKSLCNIDFIPIDYITYLTEKPTRWIIPGRLELVANMSPYTRCG